MHMHWFPSLSRNKFSRGLEKKLTWYYVLDFFQAYPRINWYVHLLNFSHFLLVTSHHSLGGWKWLWENESWRVNDTHVVHCQIDESEIFHSYPSLRDERDTISLPYCASYAFHMWRKDFWWWVHDARVIFLATTLRFCSKKIYTVEL